MTIWNYILWHCLNVHCWNFGYIFSIFMGWSRMHFIKVCIPIWCSDNSWILNDPDINFAHFLKIHIRCYLKIVILPSSRYLCFATASHKPDFYYIINSWLWYIKIKWLQLGTYTSLKLSMYAFSLNINGFSMSNK